MMQSFPTRDTFTPVVRETCCVQDPSASPAAEIDAACADVEINGNNEMSKPPTAAINPYLLTLTTFPLKLVRAASFYTYGSDI
jgi:hypothetical protein